MEPDGTSRLAALYLKKIAARINEIEQRFLYAPRLPVQDVAMAETTEHLSLADAKRRPYAPVKPGQRWGTNWGTAWFRLRVRVPADMDGRAVMLLFDLGGSECLIFRHGVPVQGLSWSRKEYLLFRRARVNQRAELYIEAGANGRLGAFELRTLQQPEIAVFHRAVWDAYWDLSALFDTVDTKQYWDWTGKPYRLPVEDDPLRAQVIRALNEAVDLFDYGNPSAAELAAQARRVRRRLQSIYAAPATHLAPTFAAMGHAHLDVAWTWPLAETARKCGRTFANVLELMKQYPEFVFVQSQPYLYEVVKQRYPALYDGVRARVREGRWIPTGCMWVESDCNLPSGESLVRQILFGSRFFQHEFNHDSPILWMPDVFGYTAALPQILRRSGIRYFFTTKLALNRFTKFPYHSFHWEGLDGSTVLAHFMPAEEYSAEVEPWLIRTGAHAYAEKDRSPIQILPFGHGDGGGGPSRPHLERLKRYRDFEGLPRVQSMSPAAFFSRLETESVGLPRWVGELYLEFHRGCYTTQARSKQCNRRAEFLLRETEILSALGMAWGRDYPQEQLATGWKLVLLNQFHDILPGSSIDEVYADSDRQYAQVFETAGALRAEALHNLAQRVDSRGDGLAVVGFNSLGWERHDTLAIDAAPLNEAAAYIAAAADGTQVPVQIGHDGQARFRGTLPSLGHQVFHIRPGITAALPLRASQRTLDNGLLKVSFDRQGRLRRIYDYRAQRDVLAADAVGNQFALFEDKAVSAGTAWEIDIYFNDKPLEFDGKLLSLARIERGPVRAVLRLRRRISRSTITQDVVLTAGSARIDFVSTVEWGDEKDVLLKVLFAVKIRSEKARYEIQFGSLERPTHWNRPHDMGRFEVPAQKWADLSEGNYGVALLNDCKYGYDVHANVMRLTLLRAAKNPGKSADVNRTHTFTYALLPHFGDFTQGLVRQGYELNAPPRTTTVRPAAGPLGPVASQLAISGTNVVIDTIKKAEDDAAMIVRLYEAHGWHSQHTMTTSLPVKRVVETDLMENEERDLQYQDGAVQLDLTPFQIRTLKLVLAR